MFYSNVFKKILALIISFTMVLSFFVIVKKAPEKVLANEKLGDITFLRPGFSSDNLKNTSDTFNMAFKKAYDTYKKLYGGTVKIVYSDWNGWTTTVLARAAAGDPIDVVFGGDGNFPLFYLRGYLQPIDSYVDLKAPYLNKRAMDKIFKFNGKYYLASQNGSNHPLVLVYNKDLMLEEGIDESEMPLELYKKGKWNWNTFANLAKKLTTDTNGDGKIDRYGVGINGPAHAFVYLNGASYCTVDKNGKIKLNFDDPKVQRALNFYRTAIKAGWLDESWDNYVIGIQQRKQAMQIGPQYRYNQIKYDQTNKIEDELEIAPPPLGPDNKFKYYPFVCDGYGISKGAHNPKGAGKFINLFLENIQTINDDPWVKQRPKYYVDTIFPTMAKASFYPASNSSVVLNSLQWTIPGKVKDENSVAAGLASLKTEAQRLVDEANSGKTQNIVYKKFTPFTINFEDANSNSMMILDKTKKTVKLSIVSGKDAIKGKSLKVECDSNKDGQTIDAVCTNPSKGYKIYGWHDYNISFDVKLLSAPLKPGQTSISASIINSNKSGYNSYGSVSKTLDKGHTVYHVEGKITGVSDNADVMYLKIGINWGSDFVIDNIKVEEVK